MIKVSSLILFDLFTKATRHAANDLRIERAHDNSNMDAPLRTCEFTFLSQLKINTTHLFSHMYYHLLLIKILDLYIRSPYCSGVCFHHGYIWTIKLSILQVPCQHCLNGLKKEIKFQLSPYNFLCIYV